MKILIDENIPAMTVEALRDLKHDVQDIRQTKHKGVDDKILWEIAQREERLLVTTDMGFSSHREKKHHGVLIVRLKQPNRQKIHERVMQSITQEKDWSGLLLVMHDHLKRSWRFQQKTPKIS